MNEEQKSNGRRKRSWGEWAMIAFAWFLVFAFFSAIFSDIVFTIPLQLAFGWLIFLRDNLQRMTFSADMFLSGLLGWGLSLWLIHAFCSWAANQRNVAGWRFAQSLRLHALVFVYFAASCALVGCVHQSIWLAKHKVIIVNQSRKMEQVRAFMNMRQLHLLLIEYEAEKGRFPDSLDALCEGKDVSIRPFFYDEHRGKKEPFLYFGKGRSSSDSGDLALFASPFLHSGKVIYMSIDGVGNDERIKEGMRGEAQFRHFIREGRWRKD